MKNRHAYCDIIRKSARSTVNLLGRIHQKGEAESVHEFRLALKKLRSLLPAVSQQLPPVLEGVFRASGRVRDLDVQRSLFRRMLADQEVSDPVLLEFLRVRRRKARHRLRSITKAADVKPLRKDLRALCRQACKTDEAFLTASVRALLVQAEADLESLTADLKEPRQIHAFRMRLKDAVYLNRALPALERRVISLEEAGEILGLWHDCETSQKTLMRFLKRHPGSRSAVLLTVLEEAKQRFLQRAMSKVMEAAHV